MTVLCFLLLHSWVYTDGWKHRERQCQRCRKIMYLVFDDSPDGLKWSDRPDLMTAQIAGACADEMVTK